MLQGALAGLEEGARVQESHYLERKDLVRIQDSHCSHQELKVQDLLQY